MGADVTKANKVNTETVCQEALKVAMDKQTAAQDVLKATAEALASLESKHAEFFSACNAAAEASNASELVVATKEACLAEVQSALSTFTELLEREVVSETGTGEINMVQDKLDAVGESSQAELV